MIKLIIVIYTDSRKGGAWGGTITQSKLLNDNGK